MISKVCILVFFCAGCVQLSYQKPERCLKGPDTGPCRARMPRLYYDAATNNCTQFIYGGCQGNDNNFETIADCDGVCVTENRTEVSGNICILKPETGNCRDVIPRLFYDSESNSCQEFTYGGCGGNGNNFETAELCQAACVQNNTNGANRCSQKPETGMCRARVPRLYYDSGSNTCKGFIYGGCGGNSNNFHSVLDCDQACVSMSRVGSEEVNKCYLPREEGTCKMSLPRLYYEAQENKCKEFTYGGCGGNENNFENIEDCNSECVKASSDEICAQSADPGNCKAIVFRYYYNTTTQKCGEFVYGGCGGNKNNFENLADCISTCDSASIVTGFYSLIMSFILILARMWL